MRVELRGELLGVEGVLIMIVLVRVLILLFDAFGFLSEREWFGVG